MNGPTLLESVFTSFCCVCVCVCVLFLLLSILAKKSRQHYLKKEKSMFTFITFIKRGMPNLNLAGALLLGFCAHHALAISNTAFEGDS